MSVRCDRCGARVEDEVTHLRFHLDLDRTQALLPVVAQLIQHVGELNDRTHDLARRQA